MTDLITTELVRLDADLGTDKARRDPRPRGQVVGDAGRATTTSTS